MKGARFFVSILLTGILAVPSGAAAAQFFGGEQFTLGESETSVDDIYVATGNGALAGQVLGDVVIAGGQLSVTGDVLEDALVVGGTLNLLGVVGDDLRVVGGQVLLGGSVGGDLVAAGGSVTTLPSTNVDGDVIIAGGDVVLDGTISGDVRIFSGRLTLNGTVLGDVEARTDDSVTVGPDAFVQGRLSYRAPSEASIPESAQILGDVAFERAVRIARDAGEKGARGIAAGIAAFILSWRVLMALGFSLLVALAWKKWATRTVETTPSAFFKSAGIGLVVLIVAPVTIVLLMMSFVGTSVGLFGIAAFGGLLILANVVAVLLAAALLARALSKDKTWRVHWPWVILAVFVVQLLGWIPVVGWLAKTLLYLAALGVLARQVFDVLHTK